MSELENFSPADLEEAFVYLDDLRASGRTNMWAAHAYLQRVLLWEGKAANDATGLWMKTFAADTPVAARVSAAMAQLG